MAVCAGSREAGCLHHLRQLGLVLLWEPCLRGTALHLTIVQLAQSFQLRGCLQESGAVQRALATGQLPRPLREAHPALPGQASRGGHLLQVQLSPAPWLLLILPACVCRSSERAGRSELEPTAGTVQCLAPAC